MTALTVADLTQTTLEGTGVFDVLMRANKAHLETEFTKGRIKGAEYATVYLGSLESVMRTALEFLMQRQKIDLESQLLTQQILLAGVEVQKANAELLLIQAGLPKINAEVAHLNAQAALVTQQKLNLVDDLLTNTAQRAKIVKETSNLIAVELHMVAQTNLVNQQKANELLRASNIPLEGLVLTGTKCKLDAEFDLLKEERLKSAQETALLTQKVLTEQAQTNNIGSADSITGKQKALYQAQADGFKRDAEQKATKILIDTWNVRRTTNDVEPEVVGNGTITAAVTKMVAGIGA